MLEHRSWDSKEDCRLIREQGLARRIFGDKKKTGSLNHKRHEKFQQKVLDCLQRLKSNPIELKRLKEAPTRLYSVHKACSKAGYHANKDLILYLIEDLWLDVSLDADVCFDDPESSLISIQKHPKKYKSKRFQRLTQDLLQLVQKQPENDAFLTNLIKHPTRIYTKHKLCSCDYFHQHKAEIHDLLDQIRNNNISLNISADIRISEKIQELPAVGIEETPKDDFLSADLQQWA